MAARFRRPPVPAKKAEDPATPAPAAQAAPPTPTMSLEQSIRQYQSQNPYTAESFAGLFPYLQQQGFNVVRGTHGANGELASDDAAIDETGSVYDITSDSSGARAWTFSKLGGPGYEANRRVVGPDGTFVPFSEWQSTLTRSPMSSPTTGSTVLGGAPTGRAVLRPGVEGPGNKGPRATPPKADGGIPGTMSESDRYAGAYAAAQNRRNRGRGMGRQGTILGGFTAGAPATQRSVLGGY